MAGSRVLNWNGKDVPEELRELAVKLGLDDAMWEKAVTCNL